MDRIGHGGAALRLLPDQAESGQRRRAGALVSEPVLRLLPQDPDLVPDPPGISHRRDSGYVHLVRRHDETHSPGIFPALPAAGTHRRNDPA